eukprot:TRINITY_DN37385_c0_g1_i1.p1 TRINITY_DN37385_c0_g1~~TRINITY_DN37385_c0_g1_i1.p1  ORF type:complete len:699 (+),score=120.72 TRINITY_DN37385_c0_g1_i1:111-2099(+)
MATANVTLKNATATETLTLTVTLTPEVIDVNSSTVTGTVVSMTLVPDDDSTDYIGLIVGLVVMFVVLCLLLALLYFLFFKNGPSRAHTEDDYHSYNDKHESLHAAPPVPSDQFTAFTNPTPATITKELKEVVVTGGGKATGLVVITSHGCDEDMAVSVARTLGAGDVRVLSVEGPDKPTRASILAGLRWLTTCAGSEGDGDVVLVIVSTASLGDSGGFNPSDHRTVGPIKSAELLNELSLIPESRVAIVYDVPSTRPVWSLPFSKAPFGCHPPGQSNRSSEPRHHLLLLSPHGQCKPGDLVAAMSRCREAHGPVPSVVDDVHNETPEGTFPVMWSNRGIQNAVFPFTPGMQSVAEYAPPSLASPGPGGVATATVHDAGYASPTIMSPVKSTSEDPSQPLWFKQLSARAGSGSGGAAGYDSDDGDKQFPSWVSVNPVGSGTRATSPRSMHPLSHQSVFDRMPTSRRPGSPDNLVWSSPNRRIDLNPSIAPSMGARSPSPLSVRSPLGGSPRYNRPASPGAAELSDTLYSPGRARISTRTGTGGNAPEPVNCLLQSLTSIPRYSYKRATLLSKHAAGGWVLELKVEGDPKPIEIHVDDISRCGAEESGGTDYPDTSMFVVPSNQARVVIAFNSPDERDAWISWVHSLCPDSVVILPSTFTLPSL